MNHGGGRAAGDEPGSIRQQLEREAGAEGEPKLVFGARRAELLGRQEPPAPLDPEFVSAFRREMEVEVAKMKVEAEAEALDAEAARQMKAMEREMAELERDIDAATGGVFKKPLAEFVQSLETVEGAEAALLEEMTPEEKERAKRDYLEAMARTVGLSPEVLDAVFAIEKAIRHLPVDVRRKGLASALWRQLSGINESVELWVTEVRLRDGGRECSLDMQAIWKKEGG